MSELLRALGQLHGRTSYVWNSEDAMRGRKVWHDAVETAMKSERHFWATINYIHNNPVRRGLVDSPTNWIWSSARFYRGDANVPIRMNRLPELTG